MYDIHDIHVAANKNILNETDWFSINTHDSHVAYISYTSYVIYFTILTSLEKKLHTINFDMYRGRGMENGKEQNK